MKDFRMFKKKKLLMAIVTSVNLQEYDSASELFIFLLQYSFLFKDSEKINKTCTLKTTQFHIPQGNGENGARYLDPKYSRWLSTDPALGEYVPAAGKGNANDAGNLPGMGGIYNSVNCNLYHYAGNNPVMYVDPDGRYAGQLFENMDDAAEDFALTYNDDSIKANLELGTYIREKNRQFYYDVPVAGTSEEVRLTRTTADTDIVAMIHTHGAYFEPYEIKEGIISRDLEPSFGDIDIYKKNRLRSYVVVPTGELFVIENYDKNKGVITIRNLGDTFPSDPNCPGRKNKLNASKYPDNYYIIRTEKK